MSLTLFKQTYNDLFDKFRNIVRMNHSVNRYSISAEKSKNYDYQH